MKIDYACLHELINFVTSHGFKVTSTTGGKHNVNSLHYIGHAVDVSVLNKNKTQIDDLHAACLAKGYNFIDERVHPPGQKVWGGPCLHISKSPPGNHRR